MKKVKIKQRFEKAVEAFFDDKDFDKNDSLDFSSRMNFAPEEPTKSFAENFGGYLKTLKQVFLFFPGTFILFYMSMGTIFFLTDILTKDISIPADAAWRLVIAYLIGFLSIFMTWFGLGERRNRNHLAIPGSIIFAGVSLGMIVKATAGIFELSEKIIHEFGYAVYLFPVALIVPILVKGWVDKMDEEKSVG